METLLRIEDVSVRFDTENASFRAVDAVSLEIRRGEILGLVGESGCGKTVTAMSTLRLLACPPASIESGRVLFGDRDLLKLPIEELRSVRGREIGVIFQEPMTALSPLHTVGRQLIDTQRYHRAAPDRKTAERVALEWLQRVGISRPEQMMNAYPHQLSGGMRQRVMIAGAIMLEPSLIIADEPTTAIDVTLQSQIFDLLLEVKRGDASLLFITHDMGVVWELCDRLAVMYAGKVVEEGPVRAVFENPAHPYTRGLLNALPGFHERADRLNTIPGRVPDPRRYPSGCRFRDRCPHAFERCAGETPPFFDVGAERRSACYLCDPEKEPSL